MVQRGSVPWLILVSALAIGTAVFLTSALVNPFFDQILGLQGWRGSDLQYANDGMRMVGDVARNVLLIVFFVVGFGFLLDARRGA